MHRARAEAAGPVEGCKLRGIGLPWDLWGEAPAVWLSRRDAQGHGLEPGLPVAAALQGQALKHIAHIFTMVSITQSRRISSTANFRLRRGKIGRGNNAPTAKQMLTDEYRQQLANTDIGYQELISLPFSPAAIAKAKKEGFAQVRRDGMPTLFITLSARPPLEGAAARSHSSSHCQQTTAIERSCCAASARRCTAKSKQMKSWRASARMIAKRLLRFDPVTTERYFKYRWDSRHLCSVRALH